MKHHESSGSDSMSTPPQVAVGGGGFADLTCPRELFLRSRESVVFEADDRLAGRCSSRSTRMGLSDAGAQCITGATRLAAHAVQRPGELATFHPWTVAATPAEADRSATSWKMDEDDANVT